MEDDCRFCMSVNDRGKMRSLFAGNQDAEALLELFRALTTLEASQSDGLPSGVCPECWQQFTNIRAFRDLCMESDRMYRAQQNVVELLGLEKTADEPDDDELLEVEIEVEDEDETIEEEPYQNAILKTNNDDDVSEISLSLEIKHLDHHRIDDDNNEDEQVDDAVSVTPEPDAATEEVHAYSDNVVIQNPPPIDTPTPTPTTPPFADNRDQFECDLCGRNFFTKTNLLEHLRRHCGIKAYACPDCEAAFTWPRTLQAHRVRCHSDASDLPAMRCEYAGCPKVYRMKHQLRDHVRIAHLRRQKVRSLVCDVCGTVKSSGQALRLHILLHQEPSTWPHPCADCGKAFRSQHWMNAHRNRVHLNIRSVPCGQCEARFASVVEMQRHLVTHNAAPTERCTLCAKMYTSKKSLLYHIKEAHEEEKLHACHLCENKRFSMRWMLNRHIKVTHLQKRVRKRK